MTVTAVFFICFYVLAFFVGTWGDIILAKLKAPASRVFSLSFGECVMLLLSMAVCAAGGIFAMPADVCAIISVAIIAVAGAAGLFLKKRICAKNEGSGKVAASKDDIVLAVVSFIIIAGLVAFAMLFRFQNSGAVKSVAVSTAVYESGRLSLADPMAGLVGVIAHIMRIHPLTVVYNILPAVLITLYCLCYIAVITTVCHGPEKVAAFVVLAMLNLWGYQSDKLIPMTLLVSWAGTGVYMIHGLLNMAAVILIRYFENRPKIREETGMEYGDDYSEEWDMQKHRIINARNLAIALGVLALALICIVFVLNSKINRLYDATVNLQTDINSRSSIYEFTGDDGNTAGYLIKNSDGKFVFVGGGSRSNADALSEFFDRYGSTVSEWYVYGDDDENAGAMREMIDRSKVNVEKIYVIDREEMTER